ncbi:hypothetical protein LV779_19800 [Streptomyces thinghirensis]|nr:hypothetical protein [Streptomyces thinghirensis]
MTEGSAAAVAVAVAGGAARSSSLPPVYIRVPAAVATTRTPPVAARTANRVRRRLAYSVLLGRPGGRSRRGTVRPVLSGLRVLWVLRVRPVLPVLSVLPVRSVLRSLIIVGHGGAGVTARTALSPGARQGAA